MIRNTRLSISSDQNADPDRDDNSLKSKNVHFPTDDELVNLVISGDEVWRIDPNVPNEEVIDRYVAACCTLERKPLYTIIEQLSRVSIPFSLLTFPAFIFKGIQLSLDDIEALEHVFKFCQCSHLSFENCNLDNVTLPVILDLIDYYAVCSELCLARNRNLDSHSLKLVASFLTKCPNLVWLDLRGISILYLEAQALSLALRCQFNTARVAVRKHIAEISNSQSPQHLDQHCEEDELKDTRKERFLKHRSSLLNSLLPSSLCRTSEKKSAISKAFTDLPPQCLRGLHLGETRISGPSLFQLAAGIRVAGQLTDLRLPSNSLIASDMTSLVPLLRYCSSLQVLDLSYNEIGDEGCDILASALSRPSYATTPPKLQPYQLVCVLRRLYLVSNNLHSQSGDKLASALPKCLRMTHLDISENPGFASTGFQSIRSGLQPCRRLVYLGLASCGLDCTAAIALAELFADTPRSLRRINLHGNNIGDAGLLAIVRSLPFCPSLLHLDGLENRHQETTHYSLLSKFGLSAAQTFMRGPSSPPKPPSVSSLRPQLLDQIQTQLSANFVAKYGEFSVGTPSTSLDSDCRADLEAWSSRSFDTFRGYRKFPVVGSDPRYLWGDSCSESNSSSSSSSDEEELTSPPQEIVEESIF